MSTQKNNPALDALGVSASASASTSARSWDGEGWRLVVLERFNSARRAASKAEEEHRSLVARLWYSQAAGYSLLLSDYYYARGGAAQAQLWLNQEEFYRRRAYGSRNKILKNIGGEMP